MPPRLLGRWVFLGGRSSLTAVLAYVTHTCCRPRRRRQLREAFPWEEAPRYLIHNRDHAFERLETTAKAMDADATPPIAPGHARQVAVRREALTLACFDRV